jgi:hypothetical protein
MTSVLAIPVAIRAIAFAALLFWVATALGSYVFRWIRMDDRSVDLLEKGLICAALGFGVLQWGPYSLGALGWMTPFRVRVASGLVVLLLIPRLAVVARAFAKGVGDLRSFRPSPAWIVWGGIFAVYMGLLFIRAVAIAPMGDDDGYHLSAPQRWLHDGTLSYLPTYTNTNAAMGFEMLYVVGLADCDPIGAKFVHYAVGVAAMLALVLFARRVGCTMAGPTALSLLTIRTPVTDLRLLFTSAFVDLGALWMAAMAALVWLVWRRERSTASLACMALMTGFAAAFKITALVLAVSWIPALVFDLGPRMRNDWRSLFGRLFIFGSITAIPFLPWPLRNWRLTGNPVYPMLSGLIPSRDWTTEEARIFARYMRYHSWGLVSGPSLSDSARAAVLLGTACAIAVVAGFAFVRIRNPDLRWPVMSGAIFMVASVLSTGMIFRYWLPGLALFAVVLCAVLLSRGPLRRAGMWPAAAAAGVAAAICFVNTAHADPPLPHPLASFTRIAAGLSTQQREFAGEPMTEMNDFIRDRTPPDAHVLVAAFYSTFGISSFGGFQFQRTAYATDSHLQTAIHFDDWVAFLEDLKSEGVTHVLISDAQFCKGRLGMTFPAEENEYPFCRNLVDQYGQKLAQFDHLQIYALPASSLEAAISIAKGVRVESTAAPPISMVPPSTPHY